MMKIHLEILDDEGKILAESTSDASQPCMWRAATGKSLIATLPRQSDALVLGTYELFGVTVQPHLRIDKPNSQTPIASPQNGQNLLPWGTISPTKPSTNFPNSQTGRPSDFLRGTK
jgi:hypothetical protein